MSSPAISTNPCRPNLRPSPFVTSGKLAKLCGLSQGHIQDLVDEGLPAYALDARRTVFDPDEAISWLVQQGHLVDPYRAAIKHLVDTAPELTAEQAERIKAVLCGTA